SMPDQTSRRSHSATGPSATRLRCVGPTISLTNSAEIRVLVMPVGNTRPHRLVEWMHEISRFSIIPIKDIVTYLDKSVSKHYTSTVERGGMVRLRYIMSVDDDDDDNDSENDKKKGDSYNDHGYLETLQAYRQIFGVIGIVDAQASADVAMDYDKYQARITLLKTALVSRCFVLGTDRSTEDAVRGLGDVIVITKEGLQATYSALKMQMIRYVASLLGSVCMMADSVSQRLAKGPPGAFDLHSGYHRSAQDGLTSPGGALLSRPSASHKVSMAKTGNPIQRSQTISSASLGRRLGRAASGIPGVQLRRSITPERDNIPNSSSSSSNEDVRLRRYGGELDRFALSQYGVPNSANRPLNAVQLAGIKHDSQQGGHCKLVKMEGDLLLMSGRLVEAVSAYSTCTNLCKAAQNSLCYAVALEGYSVALLSLAAQELARDLLKGLLLSPPISILLENSRIGLQLVGSTSQSVTSSLPTTFSAISNNLFDVLCQINAHYAEIPLVYESIAAFAPLLHSEACIREGMFLSVLRQFGRDNAEEALRILLGLPQDQTLLGRGAPYRRTLDAIASRHDLPLNFDVAQWAQRAWTPAVHTLSWVDRVSIAAHLCALFCEASMSRKEIGFLLETAKVCSEVLDAGWSSSSNEEGSEEEVSLNYDTSRDSAMLVLQDEPFDPLTLIDVVRTARRLKRHGLARLGSAEVGAWMAEGSRRGRHIEEREQLETVVRCLRVHIAAFVKQSMSVCGLAWPSRDDGQLLGEETSPRTRTELGCPTSQYSLLLSCIYLCEYTGDYELAAGLVLALLVRLQAWINDLAGPRQDPYYASAQSHLLARLDGIIASYRAERGDSADSRPPTIKPPYSLLHGLACAISNLSDIPPPGAKSPQIPQLAGADGSSLAEAPGAQAADAQPKKQLFLYDPSAERGKSDGRRVLVIGEEAELDVELFNPFLFSLPVSNICLLLHPQQNSTTAKLSSHQKGRAKDIFPPMLSSLHYCLRLPCTLVHKPEISLSPNTACTVRLRFTPATTGTFCVAGVGCTVLGGLAVESLFSGPPSPPSIGGGTATAGGVNRRSQGSLPSSKDTTLSHRSSALSRGSVGSLTDTPLQAVVVPPLPFLCVAAPAREVPTISLYEGQRRDFCVKLLNYKPIDPVILGVTFDPLLPAAAGPTEAKSRELLASAIDLAEVKYRQSPGEHSGDAGATNPHPTVE
ncbi:hypothetical protein EV182_002366, partial [Spiromyces aspiralis]